MENEKNEYDFGSCQYKEVARVYGQLLDGKLNVNDYIENLNVLDINWKEIKSVMCQAVSECYSGIDDTTQLYEAIYAINKATSIEELFDILRDHAWDLWSAASFLSDYFFEFEEKQAPEVNTEGPIFNMLAQSENGIVGVYCYLFTKYHNVDSEAFTGFDT